MDLVLLSKRLGELLEGEARRLGHVEDDGLLALEEIDGGSIPIVLSPVATSYLKEMALCCGDDTVPGELSGADQEVASAPGEGAPLRSLIDSSRASTTR